MTAVTPMIDVFRPRESEDQRLFDVSIVLGASILIAISAHISIMLPFSPVPITAQTFAVLLLAAVLGSRRSVLSVLAYMGQGLIGLPVFAQYKAGPMALLGPTGGYIVGFAVAAYVVGRLAEIGFDRRLLTTVIAMVIGSLLIYALGTIWLICLISLGRLNLGLDRVLTISVYPFIVGDILKVLLAAMLLPSAWRLLRSRRDRADQT